MGDIGTKTSNRWAEMLHPPSRTEERASESVLETVKRTKETIAQEKKTTNETCNDQTTGWSRSILIFSTLKSIRRSLPAY